MGVLTKHDGRYLHLNFGSTPTLRLGDDLIPVGERVLTREDCRTLIFGELTPQRREQLLAGQELNFLSSEGDYLFRFHVYLDRSCPALTLTRLNNVIPSLVELGLSGSAIEALVHEPAGLLLLTGPRDSGKSVTFNAMIGHLNQKRPGRILTIEDKIEYWHRNSENSLVQREVGIDTMSTMQALESAESLDVDILAVSDIPNRECFELLLQLASHKTLVVACIDAPHLLGGLARLLSAGGPDEARLRYTFTKSLRLAVGQIQVERVDGKGRVNAFEILETGPQIADALYNGDLQMVSNLMREKGMQTMAKHLSRLVDVGLVNYEIASRYAEVSELQQQNVTMASPGKPPDPDSSTSLMSWL